MAGQSSSSSSSSSASSSSNSVGSTSRNAPMFSQQELENLSNLFRVYLGQPNVNLPASQVTQPPQTMQPPVTPRPFDLNVDFVNTSTTTAAPIDAIPISSIPPPSEAPTDGMTHSLPHSKYGPYTCPKCNSAFQTSQKFAAHMGSHYKHESKEETLRRRVRKYRRRPYYRNGVRVFLNADGSETSSSVAGNNTGEEIASEAAENDEPTTNTSSEVIAKEGEPTTETPDEDNDKEEPTAM